jgi:hypothetical protein
MHMRRELLAILTGFVAAALAMTLPGHVTAEPGVCPRGKIETTIAFRNEGSRTVSTHWVDERCQEVPYGDIEPGAEILLRTYATETWRVRDKASQKLLRDVAAGTQARKVHVADAVRVTADRADDASGYQVKVLYVLPHNGVDRHLDTDGTIVLSVAAMQQWLVEQTGGRRFRFDTYKGALDIGFVRLSSLQADLKRAGSRIRDKIEEELRLKKFNSSRKIYLVYFDGDATECGGGPAVTKPGSVAAIYLQGRQGEANPCEKDLASSVGLPTLIEFGAVHEIVHALGFVAGRAPHHTKPYDCPDGRTVTAAHVSDSPNDLMYAGCEPWHPSVLDFRNDDYFEHKNPALRDLKNSAFLDPLPKRNERPPGW